MSACTFLEEDAVEVVIDAPGNPLTVSFDGTLLHIQGMLSLSQSDPRGCTAAFTDALSQLLGTPATDASPPGHLFVKLSAGSAHLASDARAGILLSDHASGHS